MNFENKEEVLGLHLLWQKEDPKGMRAVIRHANFRCVDFEGINFAGADFTGSDFSGAYLAGANFSGANLRKACFEDADFRGANLSGANFEEATFISAELVGANLSYANLEATYLDGTILVNANFQGARIQNAGFKGADLRGVNFKDARYNKETEFPIGFDIKSQNLIKELKMHLEARKEWKYWSIFHIKTGIRAHRASFTRKKDALACAKHFEELTDFSFEVQEGFLKGKTQSEISDISVKMGQISLSYGAI